MSDGQVQDVNQAETTTADASSTVEQTAVSTDTANVSTEPEVQTVPYDRFKEVNDELKAIRGEMQSLKPQQPAVPQDPQMAQAKEQLKSFLKEVAPELGFVSREELVRKEQDQALQTEVKELSTKYSGKDGRPKFEAQKAIDYAIKNGLGKLETAYKEMNEAQLISWHVQQALKKGQTIQTEGSDGSGSTGAGPTDEELQAAARDGDERAAKLLIKRATQSFFKK